MWTQDLCGEGHLIDTRMSTATKNADGYNITSVMPCARWGNAMTSSFMPGARAAL